MNFHLIFFFLPAIQTQKGWAEVNDVNLLAAGYNDPRKGSTGSGIYHGKHGSLTQYMSSKKGSVVLIADVPVYDFKCMEKPQPKEKDSSVISRLIEKTKSENKITNLTVDDFKLLSDQIELFESAKIESGMDFETEICSHGNFCCQFKVRMDKRITKDGDGDDNGVNYRAIVFNGVRKFGLTTTGGVQVCGVVFCNGPKLSNCTTRGLKSKKLYEFTRLEIKGNFKLRNSLQFPSTLTEKQELEPLPPHKYFYKTVENDDERVVTMKLDWPVDDLLTFGIWGRDFTVDGKPPSLPVSNASKQSSLSILISGVSIVLLLFNR